jgi:hypothetical protein
VRSWRTSLRRLAPIAKRTEISCCRPADRASSRFATFEHAIKRTIPTTINSTALPNRIGEDPLLELANTASRMGSTLTVWPSLASGYSRARSDAMVAKLACA